MEEFLYSSMDDYNLQQNQMLTGTMWWVFLLQVALAKANSQGKCPTSLVIQDLVTGEGQALENGDTAEVKYSGWLLTDVSFGKVTVTFYI